MREKARKIGKGYFFNNTYGLVARREIAEQYGLKTYSDLAAAAGELTFGAEYDFFEREDGYDSLCETYGLEFKDTMDLDIGLKYQALNEGQDRCDGGVHHRRAAVFLGCGGTGR